MRRIKSSAKAACSINGHFVGPGVRFVLGINQGEEWAWILLAAAALLLAIVRLPKYSVAILLLAALWRMTWAVVAPILATKLASRLDRVGDESIQRRFEVRKFETFAWLGVGVAYFVLVLAHHANLAIGLLVVASLCQALVIMAIAAVGRFADNSRSQPE